eukprot:COSAG02_NODE_10201_length_1996_cov_1.579336_3_plen_211_part_00
MPRGTDGRRDGGRATLACECRRKVCAFDSKLKPKNHKSTVGLVACWVERAARPPRVRIVCLVCPDIRRLPILPPRDLWAVNHSAPNQRRVCLWLEIKTRRVTKHHRGLVETSDRLPRGKARVREERAALFVNRYFQCSLRFSKACLGWQVVELHKKSEKSQVAFSLTCPVISFAAVFRYTECSFCCLRNGKERPGAGPSCFVVGHKSPCP